MAVAQGLPLQFEESMGCSMGLPQGGKAAGRGKDIEPTPISLNGVLNLQRLDLLQRLHLSCTFHHHFNLSAFLACWYTPTARDSSQYPLVRSPVAEIGLVSLAIPCPPPTIYIRYKSTPRSPACNVPGTNVTSVPLAQPVAPATSMSDKKNDGVTADNCSGDDDDTDDVMAVAMTYLEEDCRLLRAQK